MHFRSFFSPTPVGPVGEDSDDDSDAEMPVPPMDFAITSDRSPSPLTGDSMYDPLGSLGQGPSSRSFSPAEFPQYSGAFLGGGAIAEEIDDDEEEDEDEEEEDAAPQKISKR